MIVCVFSANLLPRQMIKARDMTDGWARVRGTYQQLKTISFSLSECPSLLKWKSRDIDQIYIILFFDDMPHNYDTSIITIANIVNCRTSLLGVVKRHLKKRVLHKNEEHWSPRRFIYILLLKRENRVSNEMSQNYYQKLLKL